MQLCWTNFLKLYLVSTNDGLKKREAWSLLRSCDTRLLRKLSTRYKHQKLSMVCPVLEVYEERAQLSLISGPQKRNVIVPVKCATKNTQFGNVMCSREWNIYRKKWETAKKLGLCYRCLGKGHLGDSCTWNRECGIDGCKDRHHRLLHEEKVASGTMEGKADTPVTEENKSSTYETVQEHAQRSIALRTVPVILKHGERRLQVNCFLDEGSDTSYVNEDVVEELGLYGRKEKVIINVANGQKVNLMSATMEIGLESLDGRVDTVIVAKISNNICGVMKPTNWLQIKDQWKHLRDIPFPKLGKRSKIDVLIGSDYYNLLFPLKEVRGGDNEPSARQCPLG